MDLRRSVVAFFAGIVALPAFAQSIGNLPPLTAHVEVNVVNVDVSVTDVHGRPITGLTKSDFRLFEDGVEQKITNFYVAERQLPAAVHPVESAASDDAQKQEQRFRRKIVLLVDNNFIDTIDRNAALRAFEKQLDTTYAGDYDWSVAAIGHALQVVQPFTNDRRLVDQALAKVGKMPTLSSHQKIDREILSDRARKKLDFDTDAYDYGETVRFQSREQTLRSMFSLQNTARAVAELAQAHTADEGKKLIILLTGGIETNTSFTSYDKTTDIEARELRLDRAKLVDAIVREANASNFSLYIVNARARGMQAPQHDVENRDSGMDTPNFYTRGGGTDPIDTADVDSIPLQLALGTGGAYMPSNDVQQSFEKIDAQTSTYYSLGYTPAHEGDRQYHKITVRVDKPHVIVANRVGYYDLSPEDRLQASLQERMTFEDPPGDVPITIEIGAPKKADARILVPVIAAMPMTNVTMLPRDDGYVGRVHIYVSVFDESGRNVGFHHQTREVTVTRDEYRNLSKSMFRYEANVRLEKGKFTIAVTLRDDLSNDLGSVTEDVSL